MKYFVLFNILFALIFETAFAQQDYILTIKNDTLYGNIKQSMFDKRHLTIQTDTAKLKIKYSDIIQYFRDGTIFVIVMREKKNGDKVPIEMVMQVSGTIALLYETEIEMSYEYFAMLPNKKVYYLSRKNMTSIIWPEMTKCAAFQEQYKHYTMKDIAKLTSARKQRELRMVFQRYQQLCD